MNTVESGNRPTVNTRSALIDFSPAYRQGKCTYRQMMRGSASGSEALKYELWYDRYTIRFRSNLSKASSGGIGGPGSSNLIGSAPHKYWAIRRKKYPQWCSYDRCLGDRQCRCDHLWRCQNRSANPTATFDTIDRRRRNEWTGSDGSGTPGEQTDTGQENALRHQADGLLVPKTLPK